MAHMDADAMESFLEDAAAATTPPTPRAFGADGGGEAAAPAPAATAGLPPLTPRFGGGFGSLRFGSMRSQRSDRSASRVGRSASMPGDGGDGDDGEGDGAMGPPRALAIKRHAGGLVTAEYSREPAPPSHPGSARANASARSGREFFRGAALAAAAAAAAGGSGGGGAGSGAAANGNGNGAGVVVGSPPPIIRGEM